MLRLQIDGLDLEILELLNRRASCALDIGVAKRRQGRSIYDAEREASIVRRVLESNRGPLEAAAIRRLFERILDESRRLERLANEGGDPAGPERRSG
jgi:chorismate mutase